MSLLSLSQPYFWLPAFIEVLHVKVKGDASPDNPSLRDYWENRHQHYGKSYWVRNSRNHQIAQNQNWKCPRL